MAGTGSASWTAGGAPVQTSLLGEGRVVAGGPEAASSVARLCVSVWTAPDLLSEAVIRPRQADLHETQTQRPPLPSLVALPSQPPGRLLRSSQCWLSSGTHCSHGVHVIQGAVYTDTSK